MTKGPIKQKKKLIAKSREHSDTTTEAATWNRVVRRRPTQEASEETVGNPSEARSSDRPETQNTPRAANENASSGIEKTRRTDEHAFESQERPAEYMTAARIELAQSFFQYPLDEFHS